MTTPLFKRAALSLPPEGAYASLGAAHQESSWHS